MEEGSMERIAILGGPLLSLRADVKHCSLQELDMQGSVKTAVTRWLYLDCNGSVSNSYVYIYIYIQTSINQ